MKKQNLSKKEQAITDVVEKYLVQRSKENSPYLALATMASSKHIDDVKTQLIEQITLKGGKTLVVNFNLDPNQPKQVLTMLASSIQASRDADILDADDFISYKWEIANFLNAMIQQRLEEKYTNVILDLPPRMLVEQPHLFKQVTKVIAIFKRKRIKRSVLEKINDVKTLSWLSVIISKK